MAAFTPSPSQSALKTAHLTTTSQLLLPHAPHTSALLGRQLLKQTLRNRKRKPFHAPPQGQNRIKLNTTSNTHKHCASCGTPITPGCSATVRIENARTSTQTRALKRAQCVERAHTLPRKSKRRKPAWDRDNSPNPAEDEAGGIWFSTRELRTEFVGAEGRGEDWAVKLGAILGHWKDAAGKLPEREGRRKVKGTQRRGKKRLVLRCGHCGGETRVSLEERVSKVEEPVVRGGKTAPKEEKKVDEKPVTASAKARVRTKLRRQGQLAGLVAKSKAEDARREGSGFGLEDVMKRV